MKTPISVLFAAAVLLAGAPARAQKPSVPDLSEPPPRVAPEAPGGVDEKALQEIVGELPLDDKQRERIGALLKESETRTQGPRQELESLRERLLEAERKLQDQLRETVEKVRQELTYSQRERFDEMRLRRRALRQEKRIRIRQYRRQRGGPGDDEFFMDEEEVPTMNFPPEMWHGDNAPAPRKGK
ncbi:MAG: hypothetical protein A2X36_00715 [Elusimicrobia bacterium GWA2_69_24]|nr:MAG: hypothetical protein A2X36_00715 [Elusimicrobia bacterium GWA2_69_24]HBL15470.1 hypothetical protein [Elusimicrobiota bacterium]